MCLYAVAGLTAYNGSDIATVEMYDPSTGSWTYVAPLPGGVDLLAVTNGPCFGSPTRLCIYELGGEHNYTNPAGTDVGTAMMYDPSSNHWSSIPSLNVPRDRLSAGSASCPGNASDTCIYAIGGQTESAFLDNVEAFDTSPSPLTITPVPVSVRYGQKLPKLTWTANFANGDTAASLTKQPTCTSTVKTLNNGTVASPAGIYPITCSGAVDPNYIISYAPGAVTVTLARLSISYAGSHTFKRGRKAQLSGYLFVTGSGFVSGRRVTMTLGSGASAEKCTTKPSTSKGYVSCTIAKVKQHVGKNLVTMSFAGDQRGPNYGYAPATDSTLVTIKK